MTADAITASLTLLYRTLSADATFMGYVTGVFQDIAPVGTLPNWCVIGVQAPGLDTLTATAVRLLSKPLLSVRIVGPTADMENISAAYQRADALLALIRQDTATGVTLYREQQVYRPEPQLINGEPWVNLGGLYRAEY